MRPMPWEIETTRDKYLTKHIIDFMKKEKERKEQLPQQEICISCDEKKGTHKICMDCIGKMIKENQQETLYTEEQVREAIQIARHSYAVSNDIILSLKKD